MQKNFILMFLVACETAVSQPDPLPCSNDLFANDSTKICMITELKPLGDNRFVELWNCRDTTFHADWWYISGMYSGVTDSVSQAIIPAHDYLVLPIPLGMLHQDALQISVLRDTVRDTLYTVSYTLPVPDYSISFCDGWYRETLPTPGTSNNCSSTTINDLSDRETFHGEPVIVYTIVGQEIFSGTYSPKIYFLFNNPSVIFYFPGRQRVIRFW
jgi:hypothetical protein